MIRLMWTNELGSGDAWTHTATATTVEAAEAEYDRRVTRNHAGDKPGALISIDGAPWRTVGCGAFHKSFPYEGWRDWEANWKAAQ